MRTRTLSSGRDISRREFLSHASLTAAVAGSYLTSMGAAHLTNAADMPETMKNALAKHIQSGFVPGLVAGVWRNGELKIEVLGAQSFGGAPMRVNSLFRLASITKPVVAAAAMILVDDGKLKLDEPVDELLPELANRKVLKSIDAPLDAVVPAKRAITLRHLLNMTFGLGAIIEYPPKFPVQLAMNKAEMEPDAKPLSASYR